MNTICENGDNYKKNKYKKFRTKTISNVEKSYN